MSDTSQLARPGTDATIYIGRQPVFDRHRKTVAYQLMHRGTSDAPAPGGVDVSEETTQELVEHTLLQWGVDQLLHGKPGYVHVDAVFLGKGLHRTLPPNQVVLEIRGDIDPDGILYVHALEAKAAGYRLALCHVADRQHHTAVDLLALADVVKVDVTAVPEVELAAAVAALRVQAPFAQLMAERVEELHQHRTAMTLARSLRGFSFAQAGSAEQVGPHGEQHRRAGPAGRGAVARRELEAARTAGDRRPHAGVPVAQPGELEQRRACDAHRERVPRFVLLGIERVRQLATMLTMASRSKGNEELMSMAAIRAGMMRATVDVKDLESAAHGRSARC
ncbi:MAG: hypothetical protein R2713_15745 [Ilumatobacteraceae bacterium]